MTEPELLRAILDDPDRDEPRWSYARWAEERQDPRAELIKTQMIVAAFQRTHDAPRTWVVHAQRARALIAKYGALWQQPLDELVNDHIISDLRFHRGFVEHVTMDSRVFATQAARVYALAPVRHLTLIDVPAAPQALASPALGRIVSLACIGEKLGDREVQILAGSEHARRLHWLDVRNHRIGMPGLEALCESPHLRALAYINFDGNLVEDPTDRFWSEGDAITHTTATDLGRELEQRLGPQPWLHAPSVFGDAFPPLYEATVDP